MERFAEARESGGAVALGTAIVLAGLAASLFLVNALDLSAGAPGRPTGASGAGASPGATETTHGWRPVAWSPDGSTLLARTGARFGILESSRVRELPGVRLAEWWPGRGRTLSVVVAESGGVQQLALREPGQPDRPVLSRPRIEAVAWSPDGQSFAASTSDGLLVGALGGAARRASSAHPRLLAISPGGAYLAYPEPPAPALTRGPLVVLDLLRAERLVLSGSLIADDDALAWSPDGRHLAFSGQVGDDEALFLLTSGRTSAPALVLRDADPRSVRWSPGGLRLSASHLPPAGAVTQVVSVRVRPDAARVEPLGPGRVTGWSPDGQTLLTVDPLGNLVAFSPDRPEEPRTVASNADPSCAPTWSEVARVIAYCAREGPLTTTSAPETAAD